MRKLACDSIAPLGFPVVPEVYRIYSGSVASTVTGACGVAAAGGNKEALEVLLAEDTHGQMNYLLIEPAKANVEPAVDYFIKWMDREKAFQNGDANMRTATNAVGSAAAKGNQKAKDALEKYETRFITGYN